MRALRKNIYISICILLVFCFLSGCDERMPEKVGYFEDASFFMNGTEYTRVEETSDTVYIKGGFIGISYDGKKSIYSVMYDERSEFIIAESVGVLTEKESTLYSCTDTDRISSDTPTSVYLADIYKTVYVRSDDELEKHLSVLENEEAMISSYKYGEFTEREIKIYYCYDGRAVASEKIGVLVKTGSGWVYTPTAFFDDEKNGIVKGRIISDSETVSYFESKMK